MFFEIFGKLCHFPNNFNIPFQHPSQTKPNHPDLTCLYPIEDEFIIYADTYSGVFIDNYASLNTSASFKDLLIDGKPSLTLQPATSKN
jgi:hypothetical protein